MSFKKLSLAFVAVFVLSSLANFLIHGILLQGSYLETPQLLREQQDASSHAPFLLLGFAVFTLGFVWIYAKGVEDKPWLGQGLRYGLAAWLVATVSRYVIYYAIQPWPGKVVAMQISLELLMMIVLGLTAAAILKRAPSTANP
ncbi:MAG TPA: hypothetical protein VFD30_12875 [Terriglobia bacterium]|jgi:hypothetical protein|nr:hypothetical protein [Terriglobia bacterium]